MKIILLLLIAPSTFAQTGTGLGPIINWTAGEIADYIVNRQQPIPPATPRLCGLADFNGGGMFTQPDGTLCACEMAENGTCTALAAAPGTGQSTTCTVTDDDGQIITTGECHRSPDGSVCTCVEYE